MKKPAVYLITVLVVVFFLSSCTSIPDISIPDKSEQSPQVSPANKSEYLTINTPYTLKSLLIPVVQMSNFMMNMDYFQQFVDYNDYIFPDAVFTLLAMEAGSYQSGEGSVLESIPSTDLPFFMFEKALLSQTEDGRNWWLYNMESGEYSLLLEILVNSFGIPEKIRFEDSAAGQTFEIIPDLAIDFKRAESEVPADQLCASVADKVNRSITEGMSMRFVNPVIIGEELIKTSTGEFMSVLVKDFQSETTVTNYWLSPDVPGGIIRISVTDSNGQESNVTELSKLLNSKESFFSEDSVISYTSESGYKQEENALEPGYSEGSMDSPVLLFPGEEYYGSVGDESTSYYKFTNNKRSDLFIEVLGFEGYAELYYFGDDSTYENWLSASEGAGLNVEDYMVLPGETVYFSIHDIVDDYSVGEHFTIYIDQNPILDPLGIMMKGDIYISALELESGKSYNLPAGNEGLDYYKTTVKKGSTLVIEVLNETDFGSLVWFDTRNGSYSGMYSEWSSDKSKTITVDGLDPGTVCYYYFSSDVELLDPLQKLKLEITEK